MPKQRNQKCKAVYLLKILTEETDEQYPISMSGLIERLADCGIQAERKAIYSDMEELRNAGYDVIGERRHQGFVYYLGARDFELAELKLLVDSVQASRFITEKKSRALIHKLERLTSRSNALELQRQVYLSGRAKAGNETIFYNVDDLQTAIMHGKQVAFRYFRYNVKKEKEYRNEGKEYVVSPYSLNVSDENYYLISHYKKHEGLTHFRVDRMEQIRILEEPIVPVKEATNQEFRLDEYSKRTFGMFSGKTCMVKLRCDKQLVGAVMDHFGDTVSIQEDGEDEFSALVRVQVSPTFFAWVFTFGDAMQITEPEEVRSKFLSHIKQTSESYQAKNAGK